MRSTVEERFRCERQVDGQRGICEFVLLFFFHTAIGIVTETPDEHGGD